MVRRRLIWNVFAAALFVVLAIVLPVPAWARIALVVAGVLELAFATLARSVLARRQSTQ